MLTGKGLVLGTLLVSFSALSVALKCLGYDGPVTTNPAGDIIVQYGNPLEIDCVVEPPYTSSQLTFQRPNDKVKYETQIVNQTTARLYIERPERQTSTFDCVLDIGENKSRLCYNTVVVDTAPEKVTEFQCRSYNLELLECKWRSPTHYIKTNYSLTYKMYTIQTNSCNVKTSGDMHSCVFGGNSTNPLYRAQEATYNFTLTSMNRFGTIKQLFIVDNYAVLIPNKPFNLSKNLNLTSHSVLLQWQIPRDIADFSPGVDHRIKYQIKTVDNLTTWRLADMSTLRCSNKTTYRYWLEGLPYAHWSYDVRIFIKSIRAPDEDEFWSQFEATTFTTPSERPPRPPRTELGAFESESRGGNRMVYVYWQKIDEYEESGENFTYNIVIRDGPRSPKLMSTKLSHIDFEATLDAVNVSIASTNNYGSSVHKSYIYVPAQADILPGYAPTSFTKTVFGNKTYDLRWQRPKYTPFDSYTLFWCSSTDKDDCIGKLHFYKLNHTKTSYRVMVSEDDKTYMFAISANRGQLSSGMVRGTCSLPAENATNKVTDFKRGPNLGPRSVELQWVLACSFSEGHVKGYNVTYCPRAHNTLLCSGTEERFLIIENPHQNNVNITGLMPHSTYSFKIAVIYKDGTGYNSNGVDATTLEDKPSEPLNLNISLVTAYSMRVSWDPPKLKNGILRAYRVSYRINDDPYTSKTHELLVQVTDKSIQLKDERQELNLTKLDPFTNYTVLVQACTTDCSVAVVAGQVRTAIGTPGPIPKPTINNTDHLLYWEPPAVPGGTLDFYQIKVTSDNNNEIIESTSLLYNVPLCQPSDKLYTMEYRVRAVNNDNDKDHGVMRISGNVTTEVEESSGRNNTSIVQHEGPWSPLENLNCGNPPSTSYLVLWVIGIGAVLFIVMVALGSRKIWIRFKIMSALDPELPPGLGPGDEKETKYPLGGDWSSPVKKSEEKSFPVGTGDEVLLLPPLRRTTDNKDFSGSSESTDSTTLSLHSKEPCGHDVANTDDALDDSSPHITSHTPTPTNPAPIPPRVSTGYKTFATQPAMPDYQENTMDDVSICSDDLSDAPLPSGYVQTATLPAAVGARFDIPSGYVRAQDANVQPLFTPATVSLPLPTPISKPMVPVNPSMPKFLPMEWKLAPESVATRNIGAEAECDRKTAPGTAHAPTRPAGGGYVSHADAVINKHLNIISNSPLGEEPALPDPNMSPEAYCRFAWNADPSADDNLRSLLRGGAPAAPALVLQAPKD